MLPLQLLFPLAQKNPKIFLSIFFEDFLQINIITDIQEFLLLLGRENKRSNYPLQQTKNLRFFFRKIPVENFPQEFQMLQH